MNQFNLKETILQRNITSEKGKQTNNTLNTVTYLKVPLFTENVGFFAHQMNYLSKYCQG